MKIVAGVDEVGRGSLIGPVYAAAVILNKSINKKLLKDSKSLTKTKREILSKYIKKNMKGHQRLPKGQYRPFLIHSIRLAEKAHFITKFFSLSYKIGGCGNFQFSVTYRVQLPISQKLPPQGGTPHLRLVHKTI